MAPPSSSNSNSAQSGPANNSSATKNTSNQSAATTATATTSTEARPSHTAFAKEGWGSRMNFQLSYGLKPGSWFPFFVFFQTIFLCFRRARSRKTNKVEKSEKRTKEKKALIISWIRSNKNPKKKKIRKFQTNASNPNAQAMTTIGKKATRYSTRWSIMKWHNAAVGELLNRHRGMMDGQAEFRVWWGNTLREGPVGVSTLERKGEKGEVRKQLAPFSTKGSWRLDGHVLLLYNVIAFFSPEEKRVWINQSIDHDFLHLTSTYHSLVPPLTSCLYGFSST